MVYGEKISEYPSAYHHLTNILVTRRSERHHLCTVQSLYDTASN